MRMTAFILGLWLIALPLLAADAPAPPPQPLRPDHPQTVSLSIESAELRAVVTALAESRGINLVGSDKLTGSVTVHLKDAPVLEALTVILRNAGYELVTRENGIYEILSREEALKAREGKSAQLKVFILKNADVTKVAKLLVPNAVPDEKSIAIDPESSRLIISGTEEQFKKAEQIIQAIDAPVPQVAIEARIVEFFTDRAESLGVSLTDKFGSSATSSGGQGSLSFDLTQTTTQPSTLGFLFNSSRIDSTLDLLAHDKICEVLSSPQVTTGHNRLAEIKVVNQVPIITRTTRIIDQVTITDETVTFKETGVTLTVSPRVLAENLIELVVEPSVLVLTGYTETDPPQPIIDTRSAKTIVTIQDGRWLVIGGLVRYNEQIVERGIPLLKDIPVAGWLFKTRSKVREKSNLVIFLSATVLNPQKVDKAVQQQFSDIQKHRQENKMDGGPFPPPEPTPKPEAPR